MKTTTISAKEHLRNKMLKTNRIQLDDKFNELIDHFPYMHSHVYLNERKLWGWTQCQELYNHQST